MSVWVCKKEIAIKITDNALVFLGGAGEIYEAEKGNNAQPWSDEDIALANHVSCSVDVEYVFLRILLGYSEYYNAMV